MTIRKLMTAMMVYGFAFGPVGYASAQEEDEQIEQVRAYLNGKVQMYYRVGGIIYGKHCLVDFEYRQNGTYSVSADTAKVTALDNVQRDGWKGVGRWDVVRVDGQIGIQHKWGNGGSEFMPVEVLDNGKIRLLTDGLPNGTERCWIEKGWNHRFDIDFRKPPSITLVKR